MCFLMAASAGGLLPVSLCAADRAVAACAAGASSWCCVGGLDRAGGFFARERLRGSTRADLWLPRAWLTGMPTGIIVLAPAPMRCRIASLSGRASIASTRAAPASRPMAGPLVENTASPRSRHEDVGELGRRPSFDPADGARRGCSWGLTNFAFPDVACPMMLNTNGRRRRQPPAAGSPRSFVRGVPSPIFPATMLYQRLGGAVALLIALVATAAGLALIATTGPHAPGILWCWSASTR